MNKAVIFDLDGVIVDTALFHYKGWKRLADELKVPFDEQANEKLRGVPRRESLLAMLGYNPGEAKSKEYTDRQNAYSLEMVNTLKPADTLPGVLPILDGLKKDGYKIAVASSSKNAKLVLKLIGLDKAFHAVVDGNDIVKGKPDPELFLKAAARLKVEPVNCLVVEDAESGIDAAIAAGMHALGLGKPDYLPRAERVVSGLDKIDVAAMERMLEGVPVPDAPAGPGAPAASDATWLVSDNKFEQKREAWRESLYSQGNGYMGVRGSVEENDLPFPDSRPGTFVAGIFDKYESWYQAIVNLPFPFTTRLNLAGGEFSMTRGQVKKYSRRLDMFQGVLTRSLVWQDEKGQETELEFTRLISMAEPHLAAMKVTIKPLNWSGPVEIDSLLDGQVDNIDFHKSGYQLRKERYYFVDTESRGSGDTNAGHLVVKTKTNPHRVAEAFRLGLTSNGQAVKAKSAVTQPGQAISCKLTFAAEQGQAYQFEKMIGVATSRDGFQGDALAQAADRTAAAALAKGFERVRDDHAAVWAKRWRSGDIAIAGHPSDQQATRFSIFHLTQFGNPRDNRVNIGSRGLTAEMHYGNCFWDTELFIIPYFIYTWPEAARTLLEYRYETLPEARNKAKRLFFKGAMFPWMSSYPGQEQADYWEYANIAVHIVGDIHYALEHYERVTGDREFIEKYGAEIVMETARFWQSRCFYNARRKAYVINTVKGPNEYDGVVNNNTYTNWQARYTLQSAVKMAKQLKKESPKVWSSLAKKLKITDAELKAWEKTAKGMFINYDAKRKLYIEDDFFLDKEPFDMKALKPGKKIITELGVSWDTLLRLQIVKQADILLLQSLFPDDFTREQKIAAYKFYEPKTCHDSSLSPCTHAIMAAQLDMEKEAMAYWDQNARLDLDDLMDNSFLGVHSACVGGTWQIVVLGFAGMRVRENGFSFTPRLPKRWKGMTFNLTHHGRVLRVSMGKKEGTFALAPGAGKPMDVVVGKKAFKLKPGQEVKVAF